MRDCVKRTLWYLPLTPRLWQLGTWLMAAGGRECISVVLSQCAACISACWASVASHVFTNLPVAFLLLGYTGIKLLCLMTDARGVKDLPKVVTKDSDIWDIEPLSSKSDALPLRHRVVAKLSYQWFCSPSGRRLQNWCQSSRLYRSSFSVQLVVPSPNWITMQMRQFNLSADELSRRGLRSQLLHEVFDRSSRMANADCFYEVIVSHCHNATAVRHTSLQCQYTAKQRRRQTPL